MKSILLACSLSITLICFDDAHAERQMEFLSRGLVAVRTPAGIFLSWRLLGTDSANVGFDIYRIDTEGGEIKLTSAPLTAGTNFLDSTAPDSEVLQYRVAPNDSSLTASASVPVWENNYLEIPIQPVEGYRPGDASVGDLDGDGELEIVLHQVRNARDNSHLGITGTPILDDYKLDGTHLWRINLGKNIREGEHYTQFMVYDLDGDGSAEIACKTADGTIDGQGKVIGDAEVDYRDTASRSGTCGRVLTGPEFFTVFSGKTGAALKTVDYIPSREPIDGWGGIGGNAENDGNGNRCDRFLACVAYLDGERPSVVMCRGVYGRIVMVAWDWRDGQLTQRWIFDSGISYPPFKDASPFSGMGGHSLSVADVDADGRDEIVYQSMVVDDNGQGLFSTGLRHGDSMHVTDMYPERPGLEVFTCHENEENKELYNTPGVAMYDARSGEILWSHSPLVDVSSCLAADIDPTLPGYEAWGGPGGIRDSNGKDVGPAPRETGWCAWWDGDLLRELVGMKWDGRRRPRRPREESARVDDRNSNSEPNSNSERGPEDRQASPRWRNFQPPRSMQISKWNWKTGKTEPLAELPGRAAGRGPNLVADLVGDWREELLLVAPEGKSLRLYTTTIPTEHRLPTLLHDPQYRLGVAWQNVVYNKPCHPSYFLGEGMATPQQPKIRVVGRN